MRRGSLASALTSIENLHKKVPNFARALSHHGSRDHIPSKNEHSNSWLEADALPHLGFINNPSWRSVQGAIISIFDGKPLSVLERTMLCENMRNIGVSDIGPHVHNFYKHHLVKRAMGILLKKIDNNDDGSMQENVINIWDVFYREILPLILTVFSDISIQLECPNVRDTTLLAFREYVLFELDVDSIISKDTNNECHPAIVQMLLVLQHVADPQGYTEDSDRLQKIVAQAVNPYLGHCGLYAGDNEPVITSIHNIVIRRKPKPVARYPAPTPITLKVPAIERLRHEDAGSNLQRRERCHTLSSPAGSTEDIPKYINKGRRHSVQFDLN